MGEAAKIKLKMNFNSTIRNGDRTKEQSRNNFNFCVVLSLKTSKYYVLGNLFFLRTVDISSVTVTKLLLLNPQRLVFLH